MNTLLSNKKTLEDSLARMRYRGQALKDSALAHSKTADSVSAADAYIQNEIKADDIAYQLKAVKYSIDSLSKLK